MSLATFTIPVDAAKWQRIVNDFNAHGVPVRQDQHTGTIKERGVVADYSWDGANLTVIIQSKPWGPLSLYVNHIKDGINEA